MINSFKLRLDGGMPYESHSSSQFLGFTDDIIVPRTERINLFYVKFDLLSKCVTEVALVSKIQVT